MDRHYYLPLFGLLFSPIAYAQTDATSAMTKEEPPTERVEIKSTRIREDSNEALLYDRKSSSQVKDVISAEQISRSGDSDAAAAMKRVSGITLLGGSSIYIRGLGERYSQTTLNGLSLPSPDPSHRQLQFDLLPSDIFQSIAVQKSYTPDLPAEFGGGATQLITKAIPQKFEVKIALGTGYSTDKVDTYHHSRTDWLGYDSGRRDLPDGAAQSLTQDASLSGAGREAISESFPNNFEVKNEDAPISKSFSASLGGPISLGSMKGGYSLGTIYGDDWERFDRQQTERLGAQLQTINQKSEAVVSERDIRLGGIGTFSLNFGSNDFRFVTGILRKTTDTVDRKLLTNYAAGTADPKELYRLQWQERELIVRQLFGKHTIDEDGRLKLEWRVASNSTKRDIPDERNYGYALETVNGITQYAHSPSDNDTRLTRRYYSNTEHMVDGQIDLEGRVLENDDSQLTMKFGVSQQERSRNSSGREFAFTAPQGYLLPSEVKTGRLENIYTPDQMRFNETTGSEILLAQEETFPSDSYQASQNLSAVYGMGTFQAGDAWEIVAGVRREYSKQKVNSIDSFSREEAEVDLNKDSALPVVSAKWAFTNGQQIRAAFSRTLARPDFRELSVASFYDYDRGLNVTGNRDLEITEIDNYDLRWELYQDGGSYLSVGAFYKDLNKPIEQVPNAVSNNLSGLTFRNAKGARNIGMEIEGSKVYGPLTIGGNVMRMDSRIDVPNASPNDFRYTNTSRAMQGAAPYAVNIHTTARIPSTATEATLLYNRLGERIMEAGVYVGEVALPDVKDVPMDLVDLVLSQAIDKNTTVKFKVSNLLGENIEFKQADKLVYKRTLDPSYAVSVTAVY